MLDTISFFLQPLIASGFERKYAMHAWIIGNVNVITMSL
jgi:hypothetical protein